MEVKTSYIPGHPWMEEAWEGGGVFLGGGHEKEGAFMEGTMFLFLLAESSCFNGLSKFIWKSYR